jgi:hypothetical protein
MRLDILKERLDQAGDYESAVALITHLEDYGDAQRMEVAWQLAGIPVKRGDKTIDKIASDAKKSKELIRLLRRLGVWFTKDVLFLEANEPIFTVLNISHLYTVLGDITENGFNSGMQWLKHAALGDPISDAAGIGAPWSIEYLKSRMADADQPDRVKPAHVPSAVLRESGDEAVWHIYVPADELASKGFTTGMAVVLNIRPASIDKG